MQPTSMNESELLVALIAWIERHGMGNSTLNIRISLMLPNVESCQSFHSHDILSASARAAAIPYGVVVRCKD